MINSTIARSKVLNSNQNGRWDSIVQKANFARFPLMCRVLGRGPKRSLEPRGWIIEKWESRLQSDGVKRQAFGNKPTNINLHQAMNHHRNAVFYATPTLFSMNEITSADVLSGRGGETNHHSGNMEYRITVNRMRPDYDNAETEDERNNLAREVMRLVQQKGGRFMKKDERSGLFYIMGEQEVMKKIKQRFYDATKLTASSSPTDAIPETIATTKTTPKTKTTTSKNESTSKLTNKKAHPIRDTKPPAARSRHTSIAEQTQPVTGIPSILSSNVARTVYVPQVQPAALQELMLRQQLARQREQVYLSGLSTQQMHDLAFHPLNLAYQELALDQLRERREAQISSQYELFQSILRLSPEEQYSSRQEHPSLVEAALPCRSTNGSLLSEPMNGTATSLSNASMGQSTMRTETTLAQTLRSEMTLGSSQPNVRLKGGSIMSRSSLSDLFSTAELFLLSDNTETQSTCGRIESMEAQLEDLPKEIEGRSQASMSEMGDFDILSTDGNADVPVQDQDHQWHDPRFNLDALKRRINENIMEFEARTERLPDHEDMDSHRMARRLSPTILLGGGGGGEGGDNESNGYAWSASSMDTVSVS